MADDIRTAWSILIGEGGPPLATMRIFRLETQSATGPVLLALDSDGHRHMLIPLLVAAVAHEDTEGLNVQVRDVTLLDGGRDVRFLDVVCLAPELVDLFNDVCAEMLVGISETPADPAPSCIRTLNRWRELLRFDRGPLLGPEGLTGLFGELFYLRLILERDPHKRVQVWTGPAGDRHDFRRAELSLEVKTSTSRRGRPLTIHGHTQLENTSGGAAAPGVATLGARAGRRRVSSRARLRSANPGH